MIRRSLFLILTFLFFPTWAYEGKILRSDKEVLVPKNLVEELEQAYIKKIRDEDPKDIRTDLQLKMEIPRQLLNIEMELEKEGGRSLHDSVYFRLPPGGATIDLASYLLESRGLFRWKLEFKDEDLEEDWDFLKVYFIPRYTKMVFGSEPRGMGCGKYAEVTQFFLNEVLKEGLLLTTTERFYLPVLGGTYLFVFVKAEGLKIASVTFLDSRYPQYLCKH